MKKNKNIVYMRQLRKNMTNQILKWRVYRFFQNSRLNNLINNWISHQIYFLGSIHLSHFMFQIQYIQKWLNEEWKYLIRHWKRMVALSFAWRLNLSLPGTIMHFFSRSRVPLNKTKLTLIIFRRSLTQIYLMFIKISYIYPTLRLLPGGESLLIQQARNTSVPSYVE